MVNPEDEWKESAVLIYVVVTIITLAMFIFAFAWAIIHNPNIRLQLKKICCCLHDSLNKYDSILQHPEEGNELIKTNTGKLSEEEITYEIDDEEDEVEVDVGLDVNEGKKISFDDDILMGINDDAI